MANADSDRGGVRLAVLNADGDAKRDVLVGTGENRPGRGRLYFGKTFGGGEPATYQDLQPFGSELLGDGIFVG